MMKLLETKYLKQVTILALPVAMGMVARTIMSLVDAAMVGRLGAASLAAVGLGGHISTLTVYSFGSFNVGIQAMVARRIGGGERIKCGLVVNATFLIISAIGLAGAVAGYFFMPEVIQLLTDDPEVIYLGRAYVGIRLLEFLPFALIGVYRGYFDGLGKTKIYMNAMIVMNSLNILLNYLLIFGKFGFPEMGVTGAAIGSAVSTVAGAGVMAAYSLKEEYRAKFNLYKNLRPDFGIVKDLFKLNIPQMVQVFLAYGGFLIFMKILGMISTTVLAAGNVCLAIMSVSYMPGYGIGIAAGTLLSQNMGAKNFKMAERYGWEALKLGIVFMGTMGLFFFFIPGKIMRIFTTDPEIVKEGIIALRIVGLIQIPDSCGMILGSCLQSAGMTRLVAVTDVAINWFVFLPVSYVLGIVLGMGAFGAWFSLVIYMVLYGGSMVYVYYKGKWKDIVI